MGKSIQCKKVTPAPKKSIAQKKIQCKKNSEVASTSHKKRDVVESYLRTLSDNFGALPNNTTKRKKPEEVDEETPYNKKPKLDEEESVSIYTTVENIEFEYLTTHLEYNDELKDLFYIDDAKGSNEPTFYVDWLYQLCDEISLEGLDGITVEALWSRIKCCSSFPVLIEGQEEIFWNLLKYIDHIQYYILEKPRGELKIYNKNNFVCPDTGIVLEPMIDYGEIYPYAVVNKDGIKGSCSTYDSRMENSAVIKKLGLTEALNIYGNRLVMVASQKMRERAIISEIADPTIELGENEYGLLERVGRAREFGELTQGKVSVLSIIRDSRSIFHVRKSLEGKKLLKKQFFVLRNAATCQNKTGKLLHLPRFYRLQKNKTVLLIEEIVELLRQKPGFSLELAEFRKYFPRSTGVNKILKIPEFSKYIKTDIFHPYRYLYPNASMSEWKYKNRNKEKVLRIFQLIDPTVNVAATWNTADNDDNLDDEELEVEGKGSKITDFDFLKEVFLFIFKTGKEGITLQELVKKINFDYYTVRIAVRKLQAKNVIDTVRTEQGKQRHIRYYARCFHSNNVPMPVAKTNKIPENLLKKILRDKKPCSNKMESTFTLKFNFERMWRNNTITFPHLCGALIKDNILINEVPINETIDFKKWIFPSKEMPVNLPDVQIIPKYCNVFYEPIQKSRIFVEIKDFITSYSNHNTTIKVILLKSMMGGNNDVLKLLKGDSSETNNLDLFDFESSSRAQREDLSQYSTSRDFLLGSNPVQASHEKTPENIEITITQSTLPENYKFDYKTYTSFDKNLTAVSLSRTNIILNEINKNLLICDVYKLQRMITEHETTAYKKEYGLGRMDKNTVHRILVRLVNEGYIKIFKIFMMSAEKYKSQWIIAHPSVDVTHPVLLAAKEQVVVKFFLGMDRRNLANTDKPLTPKHPKKDSAFDTEDVTSSLQTLKEISKTNSATVFKYNRIFGRILGYQPKFVRMQLFHELLYYLIYDYKHIDRMSQSDVEEVKLHFNSEEFKELPPIYAKEIDWKMFVPPLPAHKHFSNGWALLCDVILSIPLSLWVKIFHISIECPKLLTYLGHPVRQHYLIKDIPAELRHVLMHRRKYLFNCVELVYRLCFIGLVQLGPQSHVVKDQIFLYLNRKASLLDTSTSGPSYHMVTPKEYKELSFNFSSSGDVEDYWCQLWTISMNTPLGQRRVMEGKSVTIENPTNKPILLDCLKTKSTSEAISNDTGYIPGDKKGAGGLDSSLWFHIKRNWLWSSKHPKSNKPPTGSAKPSLRNANIASIKPVAIKYQELMNHSRRIYMTNRTKHVPSSVNIGHVKKSKIIHRKIVIKPLSTRKKDEMDAKDKLIIKRVGNVFRARFSKNEDKILYICRAAAYLLSKNLNVYKPSRFFIRDILHILSTQSDDKTSGACARRLSKLERSDIFMKRLRDRSYELISMKELSTYFAPVIFELNQLQSSPNYHNYTSMEKNIFFVHAVWYIYQNYDLAEKILLGESKNIDYFNPNNIKIFSSLLVNIDNKKSVFNSPTNDEDIEKESVRSVLMSALNCSKLGQNISYQFYQICKKYSDQHIRYAVTSSKSYQAISINKKPRCNLSTIKSIPFQLSITYNHMQKSSFSCLTMETIHQHFLGIFHQIQRFADAEKTKNIFQYTRLLARNEVTTAWPIHTISLNIPEYAKILRPNIENQSVMVSKLAELYQRYLKDRVEDLHNPKKKLTKLNRISMNFIETTSGANLFSATKSSIKKLFSELPCCYNKTILENIPLLLECNDENEINKILQIFVDELYKIIMNLFCTEPEGAKVLQNYVARFQTHKTPDTLYKELQLKIFKLGYVMRQYLRSHDLTDNIHCFEDKLLHADENIEQIIKTFLNKGKKKSRQPITQKEIEKSEESDRINCFFKYKMNKKVNKVKKIKSLDEVPTIEEIVEGMMEVGLNSKRNIPHISDMVTLLAHDKCLKTGDEKLLGDIIENLIYQYPTAEFEVKNSEKFKRSYKHLFSDSELPDLQAIVNRYCHISEINTVSMIQEIKGRGGTPEDNLLAGEIIAFIYNQKFMGATGLQISEMFLSRTTTLDLHVIVEILCDYSILLEVGITERTFVHIEQSNCWLVETFHLSPHENHLLHVSSANDDLQLLQEKIESRIRGSKPVKVIMMPWLHLDGTLNKQLLEKWLTIVLSFCLESNTALLDHVFERFYLVKPVELFFLLRILQDLKCLTINAFADTAEDLWCEPHEMKHRPANILDSFNNIFIEVHPLATVSLGHYLSRNVADFE